jgi:signal transduction histidine kinase
VRRLGALEQLLAAALIASFAASAVWISARALDRQEASFLGNTASRMVESYQQEWSEDHDLRRAAEAVLKEDAPLGIRIDILDEQGAKLASTSTGTQRRDEMRTVRMHAAPGAWIMASMSTRPRRNAVRALIAALSVAALPLFVGVSLAGRWLARRELRPLSRMASGAERIAASGDLKPLGNPGDPEEVAALATAFDRLVVRLDAMIRAERHFTVDAAHELRTPLTVLAGELEYALGDATVGARHRDSLQRAASRVRAMEELVEALLLLRRADSGREDATAEFAPVNLADVARETVAGLLRQHPERSADVVSEADDEVMVEGSAVLLESALRNLISNALKFTAQGQAVRVTVRTDSQSNLVVVEDGGPGIPVPDRESIFDPFYRSPEARASKEGFGLGLPILRRVARAHGGDVLVSTSALGGARFEVRLPCWTSRTQSPRG